jgi:hypothetical protein
MSKDFDAVEMVRKVRDDIYEQTKEMSAQDLVEFFRRQSESAREKLGQAQEQRHGVTDVRRSGDVE